MERILSVKSNKWFKAVVVILLSCAFVGAGAWIALANADEKSEDLSFMSVHLMVTKDGTSNVTQASDLVGQLSTNVSYEEQADGSYLVTGIPSYNAKGTVPSEIKVVMSGVNTSGSSGATYGEDITSKCTIVDKAQAKILIPAEYVKNVKISEGVPTLYITYNGSKDFPEFYTETYVSVTIDGNEVSLPVSKNADTTNAGQTSDHTIDDHSNYKFMSNISFTPGTSEVVEDANLENLPYNVSSLFNGDENYMDYDIKSVTVYTTNVASFDASNFQKLDNSNNQFYSVDTTRNIVTGLSNVFCKRIAVHVEAETKDILNNIVDPQLQGSVSSTSFSLKKVSGYEYSCDGGKTWQDSNVFSDLSPSTKYAVYQRPKDASKKSNRLSVTTAKETTPSGESSSGGLNWDPPFNVGATFSGNVRQKIVKEGYYTDFLISGRLNLDGGDYAIDVNTIAYCVTHSFYCQSYDTSGVSATATVTNIDRNTGVVTCSLWVAGMKHSPAMQNAAGNFSFSITIPGGISLQKVSSNEDITNGNSCYSLAGAEYSVFWDAGCTNPTGAVLVTDENGYAEIGNVSPGTYWVKETKAAPGYSLDSNPYQVNVGQGCVTRVNGDTVSDTPQNDPVNVLVQKVDAETGQPYPLGGATLEKSQFTVRYYDTTDAWSLSSDYATRCAAAKRTWVYETQEDGTINLRYDMPVSGDETFINSKGQNTFPVGTYVIEETKAPTGYLLPSCQGRTFIEVITQNENSEDELIDKYHHETYKPIDTETGTLSNGTPYTYTGLKWSTWKIDGE